LETSEQLNELFAALAAAQGKFQTVAKSGENTFFKKADGKGSRYATLADCVRATHAILSENKLCFIQGVHGHEFIARLGHASGQWIQDRIPIPGDLSKMNAQQLGSATTYLRRQTYSMIGLAPDEDDDGNEAAKVGTFNGAGAWDHSPRDGLDKINTKTANQWAKRLIDAVDKDNARLVKEIAEEMREAAEDFASLRVAVWACLSPPVKNRVNDYLEQKAA
jgi:hypothetical protein